MPMFSFVCQDCETQFEEWVRSASAIKEVTCPACQGEHIERQLSRVARMQPAGGGGFTSTASAASCSPGGL